VGKIGPGAIPTWIANPGKKPGKGREALKLVGTPRHGPTQQRHSP